MSGRITEWRIRLEANEKWDLDLLIEQFRSPDCMVSRDADGHCDLRSNRFDGLQHHREVITVARGLMAAMNGVAKVIAPWFSAVNSDKLISIDETNNQHIVFLAGPIELRVPAEIPGRDLLPDHPAGLGKAEF